MKTFTNKEGALIIEKMILVINENKQYLSDIDGLIGDGDHGINMNKGFQMCKEELDNNPGDLAHAAKTLSKILMMKIGGSMGPLYGKLYRGFAKELTGKEQIGIQEMGAALEGMLSSIQSISPAKPGDKTLMDTLVPAVEAYKKAQAEGKAFDTALDEMKAAAIVGRDSTKDMLAQLGRASRLGERSRGVLDAGATSCCLLLETLADTTKELLK
ncbi:dihydroxyacetone kinase subunit DhaL [uncultured Draconibacterium sp.]|uniref:dihydroxyacetone kinase subunit DhaL n=1 Tax=uncultured Draconibacterium sp. TaxID=1573823 RepID=UPI0029C7FFB3|nr:dihydroxyacetone kinase subunit DhaL [uncultured Draconibacterium sp.]